MPCRSAAALIVLALLPGCSTTPPTVTADHGRSWAFRCPPAGTTVTLSSGGTIRYAGEAGPGLCRRGDGQTMIYGVWTVPRGQLPSPDVRAWLASLFPASAGRSATTNTIGRSPISGTDTHMWVRDARVLGFEALDLPAGRIDAVLIEWDDRGTVNNIHHTRYRAWLDTRSGALVRYERRLLRGTGPESGWHATALGIPGAAEPTTKPPGWVSPPTPPRR